MKEKSIEGFGGIYGFVHLNGKERYRMKETQLV